MSAVPLSSRCAGVPAFKVMELLKAAAKKDAQLEASGAPAGERVIHLEIGQPSTGAPAAVKAAAIHAVGADRLAYTAATGIAPLRTAIASHYMTLYGVEVLPDEVVVTTGSSGSFVVAFLAAFDAGQRVALATPGYPPYRNILRTLGVEVVELHVGPEDNWQPTALLLEEAIKTGGPIHGLIIASPSNPTGTVLSDDALRALADTCSKHKITMVSDEIYHGINLVPERPAGTILACMPNAIVINSFSKYYSMTGWRLGWIVCKDAAFRRGLEALLQSLFISAPTLSQHAGVAAFEALDELEGHVVCYRESLQILLKELPQAGFTDFRPPEGGFYLYCKVTDLLGKTACKDSLELSARILEDCAVAITSGLDFDEHRGGEYLRFSFAASPPQIRAACLRLQKWYAGL